MQYQFGVHSIRYKLSGGVLLTTIVALFISGMVLIFYDLTDFRDRTVTNMRTQGDVIGEASIQAISSHNAQAARHLLSALRLQPAIKQAALIEPDGQILASYPADKDALNHVAELPQSEHIDSRLGQISIPRPIISNHQVIGSLYLLVEYPFYQRLAQDVAIVIAVAIFALLISMLMSLWIQSHITRPIQNIISVVHQVIEKQDYQQRLKKDADDEIGYLIDAFNNMLSVIGQRTQALQASNRQLNKEVAQRTFAQQALRNSELRLRTLVTGLTSVVWRADKNGEFMADQAQWQHYTGQVASEYEANGWMDAFIPQDKQRLQQTWAPSCSTGKAFELQLQLWHAASNEYRHIILYAVPILNDLGKPQEWMGIVDDIHEQVTANQQLHNLNIELESRVNQRTAELQNANKELEAFSYSVSHDLRAPLRSIDGFSQALLEDYEKQLDDTGQDYLNRVRAAAQRMGQLIDDLLDLSRVSRLEMHWQQIDLSELATQIVAELRETEPERQVGIDIQPNLKTYADSRLMSIVLSNLLNNAWKYTGQADEPFIQFGCLTSEQGEQVFFIRDNGAGFDMQQAHRLFGAFQRLHDTREFPGTGVGLATVQRIIHRHRGDIWAEAEPSKGAIFYFTLPAYKE